MIFSCDGNVFTGKTFLLNTMSDHAIQKVDEYKSHPYISLATNEKEALEVQRYYIDQEINRKKNIKESLKQVVGLDRSVLSLIAHTINLYLLWNIDIRRDVFVYLEDLVEKKEILIPNKFVILDLPNNEIKKLWQNDLKKKNTKGTLPFFVDDSYLNNSRNMYSEIAYSLPKESIQIFCRPGNDEIWNFLNNNMHAIEKKVFLNSLYVGLKLYST